jgi:multiple sugar transport system ATP-binding protein
MSGESMPGEALRVRALRKSFRGRPAVDGLSFVVPTNSLTVLLGAAGAGKTTTLRMIAGLDDPDHGTVFLRGTDVSGRAPRRRDIGMIFDNLALYPDKSAFENIASPLRIARVPAGELERRVRDMAATLRVGHLLDRLPRTMSGGERQRVALGRALVRRPSLCLLDEPLASLDAMLRIELRAEMRRLQREQGYTFLLATPDFTEALALADEVVMLRAGRAVQVAPAQSLYEAPADVEVARFVGNPEINLLDGHLRCDAAAQSPELHVAGGVVPLGIAVDFQAARWPAEVRVGVRPEQLRLVAPDGGHAAAKVVDVEPLGLKSTVTLRNDAAELRVVVDAECARRLAPDDRVGVDFAHARLLAFDRATGLRLQ